MSGHADPERLFADLGPTYERAGRMLSLGLEDGWRRLLIDRAAPVEGGRYLDVATGTGLVAREIRDRVECDVVGIDLTAGMLAAADRSDGIRFVRGRAERLPFADGTFDGLTVTYLLRYVADPSATMRELARVVRPGGRIAMLEFDRPSSPLLRLGWRLYTRIGLPLIGSIVSRDWRSVGAFLGRSIDHFYDRYDMEDLWRAAGITHLHTDHLSMGSAVVVSGIARHGEAVEGEAGRGLGQSGRDPTQRRPAEPSTPPAFYALPSGGWRDYVSLLHPPYTAWHLSYVALGASLAPVVHLDRLAGTLLAFFLALGIGVHALDELSTRPLRTRIPDAVLRTLAALGLGSAVALGLFAMTILGPGLLAFIAIGLALALAYPLELARGRLHSDLWFALGWGAFPVLTAYWTQAGSISIAAVAAAGYAVTTSYAQRRLSTWVRALRRRATRVSGEIEYSDTTAERIDRDLLIRAPESGLRWLTWATVLIAIAALASRIVPLR